MMKKALRAAENFVGRNETVGAVEKYGQGIIHDTYLVRLHNSGRRFILQRINTKVFKDPEALMHNLQRVCDHMHNRVQESGIHADWRMLRVRPASDGRNYFVDTDGDSWRALGFIRGVRPLSSISSTGEAREAGRALGIFHLLVSDLNPGLLRQTLPGFHDIEQYLGHYDALADGNSAGGGAEGFCRRFIAARREWAPVLEKGRRDNKLKLRVIHGDPKSSNILVHRMTGEAVSIIDLDTVMPGLVQYDIGDCLRSCCNTGSEDAAELSGVRFERKRCRAVLTGYMQAARRFLTENDVDFFFDAVRLIPFELGLRFYTDFLEGDVYFKVERPDQNLDRALVQFRLVESIEEQEDEIRCVIAECCGDLPSADSA